MPDKDHDKNATTVLIYKDGKQVWVNWKEFLHMLEALND